MQDEHLKRTFGRANASRSTDPDDDVIGLPKAGDEYTAFGKRAQPVYALHCLLGANRCRSFQYADLDSDTEFSVDRSGHVIRIRFVGSKTTELIITGRNLRELYDYLHQHKAPWIMQLEPGRDFIPDSEPVITSIEFPDTEQDNLAAGRGPAKVLEMS